MASDTHQGSASQIFSGDPISLSSRYFNELFRLHGFDEEVVSVTAKPIGTGQISESIRYCFNFNEAPRRAPRSLVGKFPSADPSTRDMAVGARQYEREARFYATFGDISERLTPRAFHVDVPAGVLFLEDMSPAVQGDQIAGCDINRAKQVIQAAAALHAARWNSRQIEEMEWLQSSRAAPYDASMQMVPSLWPRFEERYRHRITDEHMSTGRVFVDHMLRWLESYRGPRALTHGDFRLDNLLFGNSAAKPIATVDWQTVGVRGPAIDVSYFIGSSLPVEARRAHENALLDLYIRRLMSEGVQDYSFDMICRDYRWYAFYGLIVCFAGSVVSRRTPRGDDMFMAMYARHAQHVIDLDAFALLR
jgi:hypothetical protein